MPTTYRRASFKMVGTRSLSSLCERNCARRWARVRATRWLCPPYKATRRELICLPCKLGLDAPVRPINTTGKSFLIFRNRVKPVSQKYFA